MSRFFSAGRAFNVILLLVLVAMPMRAADYVTKTFTDPAGGGTMPYALFVPPAYNPADHNSSYPIIIFLHGVGERGNDGKAQLKAIAPIFSEDQFQAAHPCFAIAPQCPGDGTWIDMDWSKTSGVRSPQPTKALAMALKILDEVEQQYPINKDQEYICGLSMGGFGVWDCITRYPKRFAAGLAACGGGDENTITPEVAAVPMWAFHSSDDGTVPVVRSRNMVAAMNKLGGHARYTEYNFTNHFCWDYGFRQFGLYDWLFQQKLSGRPALTPPPPVH